MTNSAAEKNGLKNGPGITELKQFKAFRVAEVLAEIAKYGFMSAFEPCHKRLKECILDEFLIACDPKSTYGEMFLLVYTSDAIERFKRSEGYFFNEEPRQEEEDAVAREARLAAEAAAKAEVERLARLNAVYVEKPFVPREYKFISNTLDETAKEVEHLTVKPKRPLLTIRISVPTRRPVGKNALQDGRTDVLSFRPTSVPFGTTISVMQQDKCIGTTPVSATATSQTMISRKINKICQYETLRHQPSATGGENDEIQPKILRLLRRVMPLVEAALQQNESFVNLYTSEGGRYIQQEDNLNNSGPTESILKEARNFTDLELSKGKSISCIQWHPQQDDIVAVSVCNSLTASRKLADCSKPSTGFIVVWKHTNWIKPYMVLTSPHECRTFRFNPTRPDIVVAGCVNGQVVMWELSERISRLESEDGVGVSEITGGQGRLPQLPCALSQLEVSHKQGVSDVFWLPPSIQIDSKGQPLPKEHLHPNQSFQFITVSGSEIHFWDTRFRDILAGKLPHIAKTRKATKQEKNETSEVFHMDWIPIFRSKIRRMEGRTRVMSISHVACLFGIPEREQSSKNADNMKPDFHTLTSFYCASEEGDIALINWNPIVHTEETSTKSTSNTSPINEHDNHDEPPNIVQWHCRDHFGKILSLEQSPFFPQILLSVSSWSFHIWNVESIASSNSKPLLTSPHPSSNYSLGRWSLTRPGLIMLAKVDGSIEMWDLMNSFSAPCTSQVVATTQITSMEILQSDICEEKDRRHPQKQHPASMLAVGDMEGSLHVLEIPKTLSKANPNEQNVMATFFHCSNNKRAGLQSHT